MAANKSRPTKEQVDAAIGGAAIGGAAMGDGCDQDARVLAREVLALREELALLRAAKIDGPHEAYFEITCHSCGHKETAKIPAIHVVQVAPTAATLQAKLARIEALPAKWRATAQDPATAWRTDELEFEFIDELEALLDETNQ